MTLKEYWDLLDAHDWFYEMGSHARLQRGNAEAERINRVSEESPEHKNLYSDFRAYIWHDKEKPERPS